MDFNIFPIVKNIQPKLLADDIVGIRPDETSISALNRHIMEQRRNKIEKIKNRIKKINPSK